MKPSLQAVSFFERRNNEETMLLPLAAKRGLESEFRRGPVAQLVRAPAS